MPRTKKIVPTPPVDVDFKAQNDLAMKRFAEREEEERARRDRWEAQEVTRFRIQLRAAIHQDVAVALIGSPRAAPFGQQLVSQINEIASGICSGVGV